MATKQNRDNLKDKIDDNKVVVGAAIAALAAGAYFFMGPDGKRHQKKMRGWMVRMKGEVLEKLEEVKEVTEPVYNEIVDTVAQAESVSNKIPKGEILMLARDLKREWNTISRLVRGGNSGNARGAKRGPAKKKTTAKKSATKRSPAKRPRQTRSK